MNWRFITRDPASMGSSYQPLGRWATTRAEWVPIALAAAGVASSIFGGAKAAKAAREAERKLAAEKAANDAWYRRRYNEDYIDTAAGQNMLRQLREAALDDWKRESGAAAVAGGTDAAVAMAKERGNKMVGNAIANIAANDTARKDNVDAAYRAENSRLTQQQIQNDKERAAAISQAASGVSDALLTGAAMTWGGGGSKLAKMGTDSGTNLFQAKANYEYLNSIFDKNPGLWLSRVS